ncbi:MAG: hypothetical protein M3Z04_14425, partial [Chloroflexota bacterium]|nr:hypothetical protein [Chloroflexota bacterium]
AKAMSRGAGGRPTGHEWGHEYANGRGHGQNVLGRSQPWSARPRRGVQGSPAPFVYSWPHSWPVGRPPAPRDIASYNPWVGATALG